MLTLSLTKLGWVVLIALVVIVTRFILNLAKLISTRRYYSRYKSYLAKDTFEFLEHVPQNISLFKGADVSDFLITQEVLTYGNVAIRQTSGFANLGNGRKDIVSGIKRCFHESIGVYRHRMWQSINPLFWLEALWKLPENLLGMVGVLPEKAVVKVVQVLYWLLLAVLGLKKLDIF